MFWLMVCSLSDVWFYFLRRKLLRRPYQWQDFAILLPKVQWQNDKDNPKTGERETGVVIASAKHEAKESERKE
jgi:hypothetical protein